MVPYDSRQKEIERDPADAEVDAEEPIVCAHCASPVTRRRWRTVAADAHEHAYLNPAGIVYQFACFSEAPGCRLLGPPSREWSWFEGHAWRIAACRGCGQHLGWRFQSLDSVSGFFGLILDRLRGG